MCGNFIFAVATILHDLDLRFPFSGSMLTLEGASLTVAGGACGVLVGGGSKVPFKCRKKRPCAISAYRERSWGLQDAVQIQFLS